MHPGGSYAFRSISRRIGKGGEKGMSEENVNIVRQGYDAFNRGDIDTVMGIMDPEIVW